MVRSTGVLVALIACAIGLGGGSIAALSRNAGMSSEQISPNGALESPQNIALAQAFSAAINAPDVDALVDLFTEEDSGPTVSADRYAWQKFEIRLWAQQQVQHGMRMEAYDYRLTEHGAAWNAELYRDDWQALGLTALRVTNAIWVRNGRVASFTSTPTDSLDVLRLGRLWQPGMAPDRPSRTP